MPLRALALIAVGACFGCGEQAPGKTSSAAGGGAGGGSGGGNGGGSTGATAGASGSMVGSASGAGAGGAVAGSGGSAGEAAQGKLSDCALSFPYNDEEPRGHWLGADSNFSVVLGGGRALMTFQDTFVGGPVTTERNGSAMVGNSVAALSCQAGEYGIEYAWGGAAEQHEPMFHDPTLQVHRPWLHEGKLFLTATRVSSEGAVFEEHGITLARVQNPLDPPSGWAIEYFTLTEQRLTVGKGVAETDEHIYLFTPHQANMILARIARPKLLEATISEASLEYLKSDDTWAAGLVPASAKKLGIPANTGLTLRLHAASQKWLALYTNTSGWPSATISVSSADSLEGPWSQPTDVLSVPEMDQQAPEYDPDTICYGASEHDAFNPDPDGELLFTYTCNSNDFAKLLANMAIYVPRVVTRPNPLAP
jgi:hypothetical protein